MKEFTEAQLAGFRSFALPPSRRRNTEREPSAAEKRAERLAMEI